MKKRIAILSDIHGNLTALNAVADDMKNQEISDCWFLGDLVMPGPATNLLFDKLEQLNTSVYLRGNWDDCFLNVKDHIVGNHLDDPSDVYIGMLGHYVAKQIKQKNERILRSLPIHMIKNVNGLSINLSHNLNDLNSGPALLAEADTDHFDALFLDKQIDIAVYGHVHHQMLRYSNHDQLIINPGSVGQPFFKQARLNQDRRAQYAILEIDNQGLANVTFRKVAYDLNEELTRAKQAGIPYTNLYREILFDGVAHTHDDELLAKVNKKFDYVNQLQRLMTQS
ncbi:metallophosphoesterase family protein [Weissella sagaensis]|uniref:Metallophosphoesterase family protein n=2 Tax=Weissella sagaensis TaxID=2559928 RepID=A0ABW1RTQ6_9LACO|nr:metallophosphoesterase family protein [Weissella sagaensis]MBU7567899.1 metallophosphoesterase family protein [Weissella hellenica]QDJ58768.1 metallophosphoesterase [Weissella hellenica]